MISCLQYTALVCRFTMKKYGLTLSAVTGLLAVEPKRLAVIPNEEVLGRVVALYILVWRHWLPKKEKRMSIEGGN